MEYAHKIEQIKYKQRKKNHLSHDKKMDHLFIDSPYNLYTHIVFISFSRMNPHRTALLRTAKQRYKHALS